jgi:hypothetical protein
MWMFLLVIFVTLTPSILAVAWLFWHADGAEEESGLNVDRMK